MFPLTKRLYQPEELLQKFEDYMVWVDNNPLTRSSLIQKTGEVVAVPIGRPMSINAFALFARMSTTLMASYSKLPEYGEVIDYIKTSVYVNKYEGAAVGMFNSAIMIRDLGLSDSIVHILDDTRKSISELFPTIEEITAIEIQSTSQTEILKLNEADQQEFSVPNTDLSNPEPKIEVIGKLSNTERRAELDKQEGLRPGREQSEREDFFIR